MHLDRLLLAYRKNDAKKATRGCLMADVGYKIWDLQDFTWRNFGKFSNDKIDIDNYFYIIKSIYESYTIQQTGRSTLERS